uniref:Uncharacterized protein n=1 Tax=Timema cristinae TaxID=61476 RepID=A0A7R9DJY6_TIMCR|nr:unnamed protein product [Timema cristinae]
MKGFLSLLLTDSTAYMLKVAASLKVLYTKLIHVTCLARAVHRVSEDIRSCFPNVNAIISTIKKVFLKAPSRIFSFKAALPNTPLPPQPVLTCWDTWLHAALYYADHLGDIQKVIQTFNEEQAVAITKANAAISCSSVIADLAYIKINFGNLLGAITALEARDLPLVKAVKIMWGIEETLNQSSGSVGTAIVDKFNKVLQRNHGWKVMANLLCGNGFSLMPHTFRQFGGFTRQVETRIDCDLETMS